MRQGLAGAIGIALTAFVGSAPAIAAERVEIVTGFDRLSISGPYEVRLTSGKGASARLIGDRLAIEAVKFRINGSLLSIGPDRTRSNFRYDKDASPVVIELTTPSLRSVALTGNGALSVDRLRGDRVAISLQGDGRVSVANMEGDRGVILMLGAGEATVAGKVGQLNATLRGQATLDGKGLTTDRLSLTQSSSGSVTLTVNGPVTGNATGAGDAIILGKPQCNVAELGAGAVRCGDQ